ncbi:hypothetical protein [Streptococcus halichoeri]|uniref:hypothetical protein n=1 Tax=Streptococcus halichoeri TaxID=254785 RepID=UPI00135A99A4|nr:hypothetical protein [Streptococcus halichoeri]
MKLSKVACLMGSLTVLAGLMFTLGTRPVKAYSYIRYYNPESPLSETEKALENDRKRLMNKLKEQNLENRFQTKVESLDDFSKIRAVEEEVKVAEADKTANKLFDEKLKELEEKIKKLKEDGNKKRMLVGLEYLSNLQYDSWTTTNEKNTKLKLLEECINAPRKTKKISWCYK